MMSDPIADKWWKTRPDDGCPDLGVATCLECPLAQCRYDVVERRRAGEVPRHISVLRLIDAGVTAPADLMAAGIPRRTVYRSLARIRQQARVVVTVLPLFPDAVQRTPGYVAAGVGRAA